MAFDFPSNPTTDQVFTDPTTGATYRWTGEKWLRQADAPPPSPRDDEE
jgi:hypothetical protein